MVRVRWVFMDLRPAVMALALLGCATPVSAFTADDTRAAIDQSSVAVGVSHARLDQIVRCETRGDEYDPDAIGDHGTSFGAVQLHRGGLLGHFYAEGYDDPFNPYQGVEYLARAMSGEWAYLGIGSRSWSCGR
jgi:hypothetical protein